MWVDMPSSRRTEYGEHRRKERKEMQFAQTTTTKKKNHLVFVCLHELLYIYMIDVFRFVEAED